MLIGNPFFLHILVNIPQDGSDLAIYPKNFTGVYMIAYGIMGKVSNIDPDKVYDYHTAFVIKPSQVVYNVDINANKKKILNIALDKNNDRSATTDGMVKELIPFTTNYVHRQYFENFYDFTDANNYLINKSSSGIIIISINDWNNLDDFISLPNRTIIDIRKDGLSISNYEISFSAPSSILNYTICIVFYHWRNRDFHLIKRNEYNRQNLTSVIYTSSNSRVTLSNSSGMSQYFQMPTDFNGKKIVL